MNPPGARDGVTVSQEVSLRNFRVTEIHIHNGIPVASPTRGEFAPGLGVSKKYQWPQGSKLLAHSFQ